MSEQEHFSTAKATDAREPRVSAAKPRGIQFSIRSLMIATTLISVLCCILFAVPGWAVALVMLFGILFAVPAVLSLLVYGRGRARAFAVGAAPTLVITTFWLTYGPFQGFAILQMGDEPLMKIIFVSVIAVVMISGVIAQVIRWWCLQMDDDS